MLGQKPFQGRQDQIEGLGRREPSPSLASHAGVWVRGQWKPHPLLFKEKLSPLRHWHTAGPPDTNLRRGHPEFNVPLCSCSSSYCTL